MQTKWFCINLFYAALTIGTHTHFTGTALLGKLLEDIEVLDSLVPEPDIRRIHVSKVPTPIKR